MHSRFFYCNMKWCKFLWKATHHGKTYQGIPHPTDVLRKLSSCSFILRLKQQSWTSLRFMKNVVNIFFNWPVPRCCPCTSRICRWWERRSRGTLGWRTGSWKPWTGGWCCRERPWKGEEIIFYLTVWQEVYRYENQWTTKLWERSIPCSFHSQ